MAERRGSRHAAVPGVLRLRRRRRCTTPARPSCGVGRRSISPATWRPCSVSARPWRRSRCVLSFCRVAEFQRRGVVHLHAVVRVGRSRWCLATHRSRAAGRGVLQGARSVSVSHARGTARWGKEMDVQILGDGDDRAAGWRPTSPSTPRSPRARILASTGASHRSRTSRPELSRRICTGWSPPPWSSMPNRNSVICTWPVMPTASGSVDTSSPSPGATRPPSLPCGRPGRNGARPDATVARYPKTTSPRATGGPSVPAGPTRARASSPAHQQRQRSEDRREVISDWYSRSE